MSRCYNKKIHEYKPYYAPCTVCEEWWNFSNFKVWFEEHYIPGKKMDLDKDVLIQKNKIYSPETCAFVTHYVNVVFENGAIRNRIEQNLDTGKYEASALIFCKETEVGSFDTEEEAREKLFEYKKQYIHDFAKKSKGKVADKVYRAMLAWKVEEAY